MIRPPLDYEVEPDRIVRRDSKLQTLAEAAADAIYVVIAFAVTLGAICLAVLVGLALFMWRW